MSDHDTVAIVIAHSGGPEVMQLRAQTLPAPQAGEVRLRHTAIGVNFIDTYHRGGLYPLTFPSGLGMEAAGVVEALGPQVSHLRVGDRVAYASGPLGAYAQARVMPAASLLRLPDHIDDGTAATLMLKGLTAYYLLHQTYVLRAGDTVLLHAAAGGVGHIVAQWAQALGATVIGTVGSDAKVEIARAHGCAHVIQRQRSDVVARVRELTQGRGVPVVYDGIGKDTFEMSLDCLATRGLMVSFGNASGPAPAVAPLALMNRGSLYLTRPNLAHYIADRDALETAAQALFSAVARGAIRVPTPRGYALADAAQAHRDLAAGITSGACVLWPDQT